MPRAKLAKLSLEDLKNEIVRRTKVLPKLAAMRDALDKKIAELQDLGGSPAAPIPAGRKIGKKRGRRAMRASRPGSLSSKLVEVLQGKKSLPVAEATAAVLAAGYKTTSKGFANVVGMTLSKDKRFRRVRRGIYALKG